MRKKLSYPPEPFQSLVWLCVTLAVLQIPAICGLLELRSQSSELINFNILSVSIKWTIESWNAPLFQNQTLWTHIVCFTLEIRNVLERELRDGFSWNQDSTKIYFTKCDSHITHTNRSITWNARVPYSYTFQTGARRHTFIKLVPPIVTNTEEYIKLLWQHYYLMDSTWCYLFTRSKREGGKIKSNFLMKILLKSYFLPKPCLTFFEFLFSQISYAH